MKVNNIKVKRKFKINIKINNTKLQKDKKTKQKTLESHGFQIKSLLNVKIKRIEGINKSYCQTYLPPNHELKDNEPKGNIMITNYEDYIRIFYINININGLNLSKDGYLWLQLCLSLKEKGVDDICLTETNVNWQRQHLYNLFKKTLSDTWPKDKITTCTSTTNTN